MHKGPTSPIKPHHCINHYSSVQLLNVSIKIKISKMISPRAATLAITVKVKVVHTHRAIPRVEQVPCHHNHKYDNKQYHYYSKIINWQMQANIKNIKINSRVTKITIINKTIKGHTVITVAKSINLTIITNTVTENITATLIHTRHRLPSLPPRTHPIPQPCKIQIKVAVRC